MTPKLKKIIIIILIIILMFIGYAVFVKPDPQQGALIDGRGQASQGSARVLGTQITQSLLRIEQIKLDRDIFTNPLYTSLVDRSRPIGQEPVGRQNPFAPIGAVSTIQVQDEDEDDVEDEDVNI